tara:strand:+ start:332 stop:1039 length:708 start_codon:yes stop_codon:yes gene_type:complete
MSKKWYDLSELKKHHKNYHTQQGEDGLLEYIFKNIEPKSKFGVEFGAGHISSFNVRILVEKFGWKTVMWENNLNKNSDDDRQKYGISNDSVTYVNVNDLFKKQNVPTDLDLVVIDVDGQDYWIWEALEFKPQVVMIEFNTTLNLKESKVMHKDSEHFKWRDSKSSYYGASVLALKKLGKKKGYTLIDCCGRNLFFVLDELIEDGYDVNVNNLDIQIVKADLNRKNKTIEEKWVNV